MALLRQEKLGHEGHPEGGLGRGLLKNVEVAVRM